MRYFTLLFVLSSLYWGLTCTSPAQDEAKVCKAAPINPNGDTELALLMREMYEDMARMKKQIANGEKPTSDLDYQKMFTVEATQPEKQNSDIFRTMGTYHMEVLKQLKAASAEEAPVLFESVVESCMSCHHNLCPGPMVRIKKLYSSKAI